ncbi:MAG: hypothetical protein H7Y86_01140 [Rhizobacter sp.]|nr:hypothetical protein [Ferruginibacter sp.]
MSKDKSINPAALPQSEAFNKKEINQHKHLADMGKPVDEGQKLNEHLKGKADNRTSAEDGLNQDKLSEDLNFDKKPENQSDI